MKKDSLNSFFTKIYAVMASGLFVSAITVILLLTIFSSFFTFVAKNYAIVAIVLAIIEIGFVIKINTSAYKNSSWSLPLFLIFSILNGITLSVIVSAVSVNTVILAFITTSIAFLALGFISGLIKKDLTKYNKAFIFILIGLIVMSLLNLWLKLPIIALAITLVSLIVFAFIIVSDHQLIVKKYNANHNLTNGLIVSLALSLYIDFINLFIDILHLINRFTD